MSTKDISVWEKKENLELVKTVCNSQGLTDSEFNLFLFVCRERGLNPLLNHIYAIKRAGKMTIQLGIDGYRMLADKTGCYMPGRSATFKYDGDRLLSATAYVKKKKDNEWHEISAEAFYKEYVVTYQNKASGQWDKMPHVMLAKCAESAALRRAFAAELSGVYTHEEMGQESIVIDPQDLKEQQNAQDSDTSSKLEELKSLLITSGVSEDRLEEYLDDVKSKKQIPMYDVMVSALGADKLFVSHYQKWLETSSQSIAS
jgi:phage recombination protein Bet